MAFKMKAGKKGPMYKNFPSAFKDERTDRAKEVSKEEGKKEARRQGEKFGPNEKTVFGTTPISASEAKGGEFVYKNAAYATRADMHAAIRKNDPKSKVLPENRASRKKGAK